MRQEQRQEMIDRAWAISALERFAGTDDGLLVDLEDNDLTKRDREKARVRWHSMLPSGMLGVLCDESGNDSRISKVIDRAAPLLLNSLGDNTKSPAVNELIATNTIRHFVRQLGLLSEDAERSYYYDPLKYTLECIDNGKEYANRISGLPEYVLRDAIDNNTDPLIELKRDEKIAEYDAISEVVDEFLTADRIKELLAIEKAYKNANALLSEDAYVQIANTRKQNGYAFIPYEAIKNSPSGKDFDSVTPSKWTVSQRAVAQASLEFYTQRKDASGHTPPITINGNKQKPSETTVEQFGAEMHRIRKAADLRHTADAMVNLTAPRM